MAPACRIEVHPLSPADTERLVAAYIAAARRPDAEGDPLRPFTPAAIAHAFQLAKQLPGHLLAWLNLAVERAVEEGWPDFTPERLTEFARIRPPTVPEETSEVRPLPPSEVDLRAGEG